MASTAEPTSTAHPATPTPTATPTPRVQKLRQLPIIRQQSAKVFDLAQQGKTEYFQYDPEKMDAVVDYCLGIIHRDYGTAYSAIPPHGRWRHFDVHSIPRVNQLLQSWAKASDTPIPPIEAARRLVDLFVVSVLLDAGAGTKWRYEELKTGLRVGRSEGLAVASLDMFKAGLFAASAQGDTGDLDEAGVDDEHRQQQQQQQQQQQAHVVQAAGLKSLSAETLAIGMQVHPDDNPMEGLEGRAALLTRLGAALEKDEHGYFKGPADQPAVDPSLRRPGFMIDYLLAQQSTTGLPDGRTSVSLPALWDVVIQGFASIWPSSRTMLDGVSLGDVWLCDALLKAAAPAGDPEGVADGHEEEYMVAFHKLSQWLTYSIMEPMEKILGWTFQDAEHMTGLPEYRNGGLLIDLGVLVPTPLLHSSSLPRDNPTSLPRFQPSHPAIVEWRALTVILLDRIASALADRTCDPQGDNNNNNSINSATTPAALQLKQVLEAATWKGGREIARERRPETGGGPPIEIESDGTLF